MIEIEKWMELFLQTLDAHFGKRVWFVGLQGSYSRGEATQTSDIDVVVILDQLTPPDIRTYHTMLDTLPHRELICGFLSGKEEILNWEPSDLFQFYHDTMPIRGSLEELLEQIDEAAVNTAIKIGACNIYHGCVHNMLHEKSNEILKGLYKSASFVIQAICFRETGNYVRNQCQLRDCVAPDDRVILDTFMILKSGGAVCFQQMSETLFAWAQSRIAR